MSGERFCFEVEWYDPSASQIRKYQLFVYPKDQSIEMFDFKNQKCFLRRTKYEALSMDDCYIGSTVTIFGRALTFTQYGDDYTRDTLAPTKQCTTGIILPDGLPKMGAILDIICKSGFLITKLKMVHLSRAEAFEFYKEEQHRGDFNALMNHLSSGRAVAFELLGEDAVNRWKRLVGPADPAAARSEAPLSIRARFGKDSVQKVAYAAESDAHAARDKEFFFPTTGPCRSNTATFSECTCAAIKPHAVVGGQAGNIVTQIIDAGFEISAMQIVYLERANAQEFLEVYKGVVQEYPKMVEQFMSGPLLVMEIRAENAPFNFREMTGPADPEIARHLRPRTIRAQFGKDKIKNAIHCSDLPEDALLEVEYFFKVLEQ